MIAGMTAKITVSLPDAQVDAARRAVKEGRAASVSAYVSAAIAAHHEGDSLQILLDDLDAIHGPVGREAMEWARGVADRLDARRDPVSGQERNGR